MSIPPTIDVHSQEGWVVKGTSQRRPGLHVDSPGEVIPCSWKESFFFRKSEYKESIKRCRKHWKREKRRGKLTRRRRRRLTGLQLSRMGTWLLPLRHTHQRGRQVAPCVIIHLVQRYDEYVENCYVLQGGIYIASNVAHSTKVWDCRVDASEVGRFNLT